MKNCGRIVAIAFLGVLLLTPAFGQFSMKVGPTIGMNFNIHSGSDLEETGTGLGLMIGSEADMSFSPVFGIIARLIFYDNMSGSNSTTGTYYGTPYTADQDASVGYFTIDALCKVAIPRSGFYFFAGPSFGIPVEGQSTTTIKAQGYQDSKTKASLQDQTARFALKFGAGYDIPITRTMDISPDVSFSMGLTKVVSDVSWRIMSIHAGATLKFHVL